MRYEDILNSITELLYDKTGAEIDCEDINQLTPGSYFIDVINYRKVFDSQHVEKLYVTVDILYLAKKKSHLEIMNALDDIDDIFEMNGKRILKVGDRVLTIKDVSMDDIDFIGHYTFELELYDQYGKFVDYGLMNELDIKFEKEA